MSRPGRILGAVVFLAALIAAGGLGTLWLIKSRVATRIVLTLTADRVGLVLAGPDASPVLDAVSFRSLQAGEFSRVILRPAVLERADPDRAAQSAVDTLSADAWTLVDPAPTLTITGPRPELQPSVTLEPTGEAPRGRLQLLNARPGSEVTLELSGGRKAFHLSLRLAGAQALAQVNPGPGFLLFADNCTVEARGLASPGASEILRAARADSDPLVAIAGGARGLRLDLELELEQAGQPVTQTQLEIEHLQLERQGARGERVSTLVADGAIGYPDYPSMAPRPIARTDFLSLDGERPFRFLALTLTKVDGRPGLRLEVAGLAANLRTRTGTSTPSRDHRLSRFDVLRADPTLKALFIVVGWLVATAIAAWRFSKELRA